MTDTCIAKPPEILYVASALNVPPHTGCMIRAVNVCRQLSKCGQVTMLAISYQYDPDSVKLCKQEFDRFHQIKLKSYNDFPFSWGRFLKKWHMHWPASRGLQASNPDKKLFRDLASRNDIVWFHTLGAAAPFSLDNISHSVMDLDDLNHCKYDLRSQNDKSLRLRLSATVQAYKWKGHEFDALKQYDIVTVCSRQDKQYLGADNVRVIPNGFAMPPQKPEWKNPDPNRLGFIGTLGYGPNYEGLVWFRNQVWPLLRKQNPNLTLRLIGAPPQPQYVVRADGFEYLGYIEDSAAEIDTWSAMIIPITYGGGTRIKILDAFSKMCPVVSTSIGAHGIAGVHDEHFLLADEPKRFADNCLQLTVQPDTARRLAESAWQLFNEKYNWDVIGISIQSIVEKMMEKR